MIRRPGWKLQLLGGMPADQAPLEPYRDEVEWLGRVGHAEMPALMAEGGCVCVSRRCLKGRPW